MTERSSKRQWHDCVGTQQLEGLRDKEKELCEVKFEILTTEEEYSSRLKDLRKKFVLELLGNVKISSDCDAGVKKHIFIDLNEVCNRSENLLKALEKCWTYSDYLHGIFDTITEHFTDSNGHKHDSALVNYCAGYEEVIAKILVLRRQDEPLEKIISALEERNRDVREQLRDPMDHIMRLKILLDRCCDVMNHLSQNDESTAFKSEYESCMEATDTVSQVCEKVNKVTGIKRSVRGLVEMQESMEFPSNMTPLSLVSENRWVIKKGPLTQVGFVVFNGDESSFQESIRCRPRTAFLFNDLIILTKQTSVTCHVVKDYGTRPEASVSPIQLLASVGLPSRVTSDDRNYFPLCISMCRKQEGYTILSCRTDSEREEWLEAMNVTSAQ